MLITPSYHRLPHAPSVETHFVADLPSPRSPSHWFSLKVYSFVVFYVVKLWINSNIGRLHKSYAVACIFILVVSIKSLDAIVFNR